MKPVSPGDAMPPSERQSDPSTVAEPPRSADLRRLVDLVERLRAPDGCPWDREQGLDDLRAYLIEEAHEAAAAIDREAWPDIAEELGDVVFLAAFVARLAEEGGRFTVEEMIAGAAAKIVARHPHVFDRAAEDAPRPADAAAVRRLWEARKAGTGGERRSLLGGLPASLPGLVAAYRLTQKAAGVGFDWNEAGEVLDKLDEEIAELRAALAAGATAPAAPLRDEIGDLLFTVANLSRKLEIDPDAALAGAIAKFRRRFEYIEERLAETGRSPSEAGLDEMESLWRQAKESESGA